MTTTCRRCGLEHMLPLDAVVVERCAAWLEGYLHEPMSGTAYYSTQGEAERETWRVDARCLLSAVLHPQEATS